MNSLIEKHLELVIEANKKVNLTRIDTWEDGMVLHVQDSLLGLEEVNDAPRGRYADLGTGAGYPGIPIAIETQRDTLLVDSVKKKVAVLDSFIEQLGLEDVATYCGRIEDLAKREANGFAVVTARALASLSVLMELASPLLFEGGRLVCYKAQPSQDEVEHALSLQEKLGMRLVSDREAPLGEFRRRIITFEKTGEPLVVLPRRVGMAQKRPL